MGEVIPRECITNVLHENEYNQILSLGWDGAQMWEEWKLLADHTALVSQAMAEPMEEEEEEV